MDLTFHNQNPQQNVPNIKIIYIFPHPKNENNNQKKKKKPNNYKINKFPFFL